MVEGNIHNAKITRPMFRGSLPRERLFRLLDGGRDRPVTWVSGPPGSGKTSLVSGYLEARKLPCIWYRADKGDADPATVFHYLGIAAQAALPGNRKPLPKPAPSDLSDIRPFARRYFRELFDRLGSRTVLVCDECDNVTPGSSVETAVRDGIHLFPKGLRAIFLSRCEPAPDFIREVDSRRLESIGWKELRLTPEETAEIARIQRKDVSPETIRYLHDKAGGWVTGVVLLLERAQRDRIEPQHIGQRTPEEIVEYFGGDLIRDLGAETREFLMRIAFLPRMTARTAEALTGHPKASRILSYLNRHNFFTEVHPGEEPVYEFNTMFREFLLHHAKGHLSPEEARATWQRAVLLLEDSGQTVDAVDLLRRCGDFRGVCRVIRKEAPSLARQGRIHTLGEWILSLPEDLRAEDPWLLYWIGVCSNAQDPAESRAAFERALELFSLAGDEAGAFLSWSGIVDTILFEWNDIHSLDRWIDWLDHRRGGRSPFPSSAVEARVCAAMATALLFRRPQHEEIAEWIRRAMRLSRDVSDPEIRLHAFVANSKYCLWIGDRAGNDLAMKGLRRMARSQDTPPSLALSVKFLEAMTAVVSEGAPDDSLRLVEEGLRIADSTSSRGWDFQLNAIGACAALTKGDGKAARKFLEGMAGMLSPARRHGYCQYHYLAAWAHLNRGETLQAGPHAEDAVSVAVETGMYFPEVLCRLALAQVRHEKGDAEGAREELARALSLAVSGRSRILEFMALLSKAQFLLDRGNEPDGLEALREAMAIGRAGHYLNLFWWWRPKTMARLCTVALEAGIEVPYVREMILKNRLVPDPSAPDHEKWPWPVRVYTLGRFSLVVDGKVLPPARKTRQKPLLLLKALIALGGREVPEEQLTEILWPDADGDLAHQSLAKTIERLREMLGDDKAVLLRDGRLTLSNRHCWVDVWELERKFGRADAVRNPGGHAPDGGEVVRLVERAIALYQGAFLSGETFCFSIVTYRERLRSKFLRAVLYAGNHWEKAGEGAKAIVCYQKGLEVDPISEDIFRCLISCNLRMGHVAEAHAAYRRCYKTLTTVLGVSPSSDLLAMLTSYTSTTGPVRELKPPIHHR
ncbi:MAG: BTAD domain-containing putative transcriptional regulator [Actinomycetota bacterium]